MKPIHRNGVSGNRPDAKGAGIPNSSNNLRHDVLPEYYALQEIRWQWFIGLTFNSQRLSTRIRKRMVDAWLLRLAAVRPEYQRLQAVYRFESGTSGEHFHAHVLIAGLTYIPLKFRDTAQHLWMKQGRGFSSIRKYDPKRDGLGYVLKKPASYGRSQRYGDDEIDIPTLSPSLIAFLRKRRQRRG
jgi:hypothetical protein